jgi:hypothetical protein
VQDALLERPKPIVGHRRRALRRLATRLARRIARTRSSTGVPRNRTVPARDAVLAGDRIDNDDASQVEHRSRVIVLEAREPRLQLLDSRELELSEQGDAGGLALFGDEKLWRHFD